MAGANVARLALAVVVVGAVAVVVVGVVRVVAVELTGVELAVDVVFPDPLEPMAMATTAAITASSAAAPAGTPQEVAGREEAIGGRLGHGSRDGGGE